MVTVPVFAPVAIVGGGISGLATAYYLAKAGIPSRLIEAQPRLGGVIQTEQIQGCVIEGGPDSFLAAKPWAMELIGELGLADEVISSNDHLRKTFIWKSGRLIPLPDGLQFLIPTRILPMATTPLLGWGAKFGMAAEFFRKPVAASIPERSVADFVVDHYGREVLDYIAEPLLSGVYGGDPAALSLDSVLPTMAALERKYGSLTRGVLAQRKAASGEKGPLFRTLRGGMAALIEALQSAVSAACTVTHGRVEQIEHAQETFRLRVAGDWIEAPHVVLACEAHQAAGLLKPLDTELASLTGSIPYSSSMTVALGFDRQELARPLDGFGFLVPRREQRQLVACTWVGTKFAHRTTDSMALLRCFLGGAGQAQVLDEGDDRIIATVLAELGEMMGIRAQPRFTRVFRWPRSMAQYTVGHAARVAGIEARVAAISGLHLTGNAYHGIGIPDCIRLARENAAKIAAAR